MKIISVVGARPNFMKVAPLHRTFAQDGEIQSIIVHTGQHYDERMSQVFFDQLGLPKPDHFLGIGGGSHTEQTAQIMLAFEKILDQEKPDLVIVVGDVNSTVACALTAVKKQIKVAHVEAGLRSGDRKMPEEINRVVTDAISDLLFVSEIDGSENLLAEGIDPQKIHFVGNIMIDSLVHFLPQADTLTIKDILERNQINLQSLNTDNWPLNTDNWPLNTDYCLLTMHRPSNVDHHEGLTRIIEMVLRLSSETRVVFAVHPRTKKNLEKYNLWDRLASIPNLILTHPLSYLDFLKVMKEATIVITDSGGIQEETTFLKVPCITFRSSTERPSTVTIGSNTLISELDVEKVWQAAQTYLMARQIPIYDQVSAFEDKKQSGGQAVNSKFQIPELWDGQSAVRILKVIQDLKI